MHLSTKAGRNATTALHLLRPIASFLDDDGITEVAINVPGEVWSLGGQGWARHAVPELDAGHLKALETALIAYGSPGGVSAPMVPVMLPGGERCQIVRPPACMEGMHSFTIRKHAAKTRTLEQLRDEGAFEATRHASGEISADDARLLELYSRGDWVAFLREAVRLRLNIIVSGATGSGKTTFMRSLVDEIDLAERLVTIEDTPEILLAKHLNKVHLLYSRDGIGVSGAECLRASLRMLPHRILPAELRGDEAWMFITACNTGHPGSITTVHANSAADTFDRVAQLVKESRAGSGLDVDYILRVLHQTLHVVVFMANRRVVEMRYRPLRARSQLL